VCRSRCAVVWRSLKFPTAQEIGWGRVKNGELLKRAEGVFDVFLTADQQLKYQQI